MPVFLVKATVWLALVGWAVGIAWLWGFAPSHKRESGDHWKTRGEIFAYRAWLTGLALFIAHVILAYGVHYQWSQAVALDETARQTTELTGRPSTGSGLYWNYAFGFIWIADASIWWRQRKRRTAGPSTILPSLGWLRRLGHLFMAFIVINGAIIFGQGPVRWYGIAVFGCLMVAGIIRLWTKRRMGGDE